VESRATLPLILSTVVISAVGIALPFTPIGAALEMAAMPLAFIPTLFGIILVYALMVQVLKSLYIKRYGHWI